MNSATKQIDQAEQVGTDAQGLQDRRLTYFSDHQETRSAWLHYMNSKAVYPKPYLEHFHSRKMYIDDSEYWVPLGKVTSVPAESNVIQSELELIPVFPAMFQTHDGTELTGLEKGYLYVFVDGHLWREIYCDAPVQCFRDVNLTIFQGQDARPHSGVEFERFFVLLPQRMNNKNCKVDVAYSEVQWSWDYIVKLGGMAKDDPRYFADAELVKDGETMTLAEYESKIDRDDDLHAKRCQEIKFEQYNPNSADAEGVKQSFLMPVKRAHALNNQPTGVDGYDFPRLGHLTQDIVNTDLPVLALKHPIKVARDLAAAYMMSRGLLEMLVEEMSGKMRESDTEYAKKQPDWQTHRNRQAAEFELAVFVNQYFYQNIEAAKQSTALTEEARKTLKEREAARDQYFDDADFKKYLHIDDIKILIDKVHERKQALIDYLNIQDEVHSFSYAMYDFFSLNGSCYIKGFELFSDLIATLKDHPASQVQHLRQNIDEWDDDAKKDEGQDFLLTLLGVHPDKPPHKACECLFPKQTGGDCDDLLAYDTAEVIPKGGVTFSCEKFAALTDTRDDMDATEAGQPVRRVALVINNFMSLLAEASFDRGKLVSENFDQKRSEANTAYKNEQAELARAENKRDLAENELTQSQQSLADSERNLNQAERAIENARQRQLSEVEIQIKQQELDLAKANLNSANLNHQAKQAQLKTVGTAQTQQLQKYQDTVKTLRALGVTQPSKSMDLTGLARFHHARGNYMLPIVRWHRVANTVPVTQVKISLTDYFNGRYPNGTIPFNISIRVDSARHLINELNRYAKLKTRKALIDRPGKPSFYTLIDDLLHMRGELATMMQLTDAAHAKTTNQVEQKIRVLAYELSDAEAAQVDEYRTQSDQFDAEEKRNSSQRGLKFWSEAKAEQQGKVEAHKKLSEIFNRTMRHAEQMMNHPVPDRLNLKGKTAMGGHATILGGAMWFELNNLRYAWSYFMHDKVNLFNVVNLISAAADTSAVIAGAADTIKTYRYGRLTNQQLKLLNQQKHLLKMGRIPNLSADVKKLEIRAKFLNRALFASLAANILSFGIAGYEVRKAALRGDVGAVIGNAIMMSGFVLMAGNDGIAWRALMRGAVKNPMGKMGWIGFAIVLAGAAVIYFFSLKDMEAWLAHCPWGKSRLGKLEKDPGFGETVTDLVTTPIVYKSWYDHPEYAYLDLLNIVMQPRVTIKKLPAPSQATGDDWQQRIKLNVILPGYSLGTGYVDIQLQAQNPRTLEYERFDLLTDDDLKDGLAKKQKETISKIWQHAKFEKDESNQSYTIIFTLDSFRDWLIPIQHGNNAPISETGWTLALRIFIQVHPNGQNESLIPGHAVKFCLPVTMRNDDGTLMNDNPDIIELSESGGVLSSPTKDKTELNLYRQVQETLYFTVRNSLTTTAKKTWDAVTY